MLIRSRVWQVGRMVLTVIAVGALFATPSLVAPIPAQAASAEGFKPGNIISDNLFYDGNASNSAEIQKFLDQKVPNCLIGTPPYMPGSYSPSGTGNIIASTCLKSFQMTTPSRAADAYCKSYPGAFNESAAQIIAKVSQACGISPKVLLVMLEKEQSLVTDRWPVTRQYNFAMGMNCPDSGPGNSANCNSDSAGFFLQIFLGARQLKVYKGNPDSFRYRPFQVNTIQWHPNADCGTSQVYIENWATAALYIYTPYRPNDAALRAGWGAGDTCSSYGNRNFYLFFTEWFGSTQGASLSPVGAIEAVIPGFKSATVAGYAFDPETSSPIDVHFYIGGLYGVGRWGGSQVADKPNPTVLSRYPSYGERHGFEKVFGQLNQPTTVCVYGINVGQGDSQLLGCPVVAPTSGLPIGNFESLKLENGKAVARGWLLDPDDVGAVSIHAYAGGDYTVGRWAGQFETGVSRLDVWRTYPEYGKQNGFEIQFEVPVGTTDFCLYSIDREGKGNSFMGCRSVSSASGPPFGNFEGIAPHPGGARLGGWVIDPDTSESVAVHVYVDGRWGGAYIADSERLDVSRAYPGYGAQHGFSISLNGLSSGNRKICVYGIDVRGTSNPLIGCRDIFVYDADPFGSFDGISAGEDSLNVAAGWAIDPDVAGPVQVHAYLNDRWFGSFVGDKSRPDVLRAYPESSANQGFAIPINGSGRLCVYAINAGQGSTNPLLGCRVIG